jgi:cytochrome P450
MKEYPISKHEAIETRELISPPVVRETSRELLRDPLAFFLKLTREYGNVVCYRPAPEKAFLVNHPDYAAHILVDNSRNYSKATYTNQMFKEMVADGLLVSEGEVWLRQRRLMQPAFHHQRLEALVSVMVEEVSEVIQRWKEFARTGEPVNMWDEMAGLTLSITTRVLFGVDLEARVNAVGQAMNIGADLLEKPRRPRFRKAFQMMIEVVDEIITRRRSYSVVGEDLLSRLMLAGQETGEAMDDREIRQQVITLLLAGYETTANALTWTWYLLAQHPDSQKKLNAEARAVLGNRSASADDLPSLGYTRMVFEEGMRLYPPAWVLGRKALGDDRLGNYRIPAGATIAISPYTLHRHLDYWEDPDIFNPERFSPERSASRARNTYIPFGVGQRQCIGKDMALIEAPVILSGLAREFYLHLLPDQEIRPQPLFVLRPDRPVLMQIEAL